MNGPVARNVGEDFSPPAGRPLAPERVQPVYPQRKRNRLPAEIYRQGGAFFLTTTVRNRRRAFSSAAVASRCLSILRDVAAKSGVEIDTYCLMPDHLHLLATAEENVDIVAFVHRFKQAAAIECNREIGWQGAFWQASYYDHVLREIEDVGPIRDYILGNPVRARIVEDSDDYPFAAFLAPEPQE